MRPSLLALAALVLIPGAAAAQSLDVGDGSESPVLETEDAATPADSKLGDLEDQVKAKGPLALEPKLDLTAEEPDALSGITPPSLDDPNPAPGFVLKIPTN